MVFSDSDLAVRNLRCSINGNNARSSSGAEFDWLMLDNPADTFAKVPCSVG
jgi:hypothetical protein